MSGESRMLTHQQATSFYNYLGAKQDWQAFFEAPATLDLIAHASFETAQAVFEFGCGTGAFAEQVLAHHLPQEATYLAVDSSATMVRLARSRLARFGEHVAVRQTDGSLQFDEVSGSFERFVSNYVLDLLSLADIAQLLAEAHRLLVANGRLCLVSLTRGSTPLARLVTRSGHSSTRSSPFSWVVVAPWNSLTVCQTPAGASTTHRSSHTMAFHLRSWLPRNEESRRMSNVQPDHDRREGLTSASKLSAPRPSRSPDVQYHACLPAQSAAVSPGADALV